MGVGGQCHIPDKKKTGTHCIKRWVGSRTGLDGCGKSLPRPDSIPEPSGPPLTHAYSLIMRQVTHVKENLELRDLDVEGEYYKDSF